MFPAPCSVPWSIAEWGGAGACPIVTGDSHRYALWGWTIVETSSRCRPAPPLRVEKDLQLRISSRNLLLKLLMYPFSVLYLVAFGYETDSRSLSYSNEPGLLATLVS